MTVSCTQCHIQFSTQIFLRKSPSNQFPIIKHLSHIAIKQDSIVSRAIEFSEGYSAACDVLAQLAGATDQAQRAYALAEAIGDLIDVCLNLNNMAPTQSRLQGFAEVLVQHLNLNVMPSPSQTAEVPHQDVNVPTSGVTI